jgi:hypothetical protein
MRIGISFWIILPEKCNQVIVRRIYYATRYSSAEFIMQQGTFEGITQRELRADSSGDGDTVIKQGVHAVRDGTTVTFMLKGKKIGECQDTPEVGL